MYIYFSNETPNLAVFFDNVQVTAVSGLLLKENHYYPFGLIMAGLSSKALAFEYPKNNFKFNDGSEFSNKDFCDETGLELYLTNYRLYDPQIGRFIQMDPMSVICENWSTFTFASNNPILRNDPLGLKDTIVTGKDGKEEHALANVTLPEVIISASKKKVKNSDEGSSAINSATIPITIALTESSLVEATLFETASIAPPIAIGLGIGWLLSGLCHPPGEISIPLPRYGPIDNTYNPSPKIPRITPPIPGLYFAKELDDYLKGGSQKERDRDYGIKDPDFLNWWHREGKPSNGGREFEPQDYRDWKDLGRPKGPKPKSK